MKNKLFILLLLFAFPVLSFSQEILTGLHTNPVISTGKKVIEMKKVKRNILQLPFFDDFSGNSYYPNDTLWADKNVYINSSYPYLPVTIGVATFDALNDTGAIYPEANQFGFIADSLTSNPIRLDAFYSSGLWTPLKKSDSVYFSFYYQPQGMGNSPQQEDSLVLEFFSPQTSKWKEVWSSPGMTLAQFHNKYNEYFKQIMIPVDSANYFQQGFRFRFYNYASLANSSQPAWGAGNIDIWNLDYVYLNKGRNKGDSIYRDIAFVEPAPSMLKNYTSMPWSQYVLDSVAEMKDSLHMTITNRDTVTYNSSYKYEVMQEGGGSWNFAYNGGSFNILPFITNGYQTYAPHATPPVGFTFPPITSDSALFTITHVIKEGILGDIHRQNDTTIFEQKFYNYYAYDDGVPEAGYGLDNAPNGFVAYKFTLNHPDTLRAVNIFFNRTLDNASQHYFNLNIWDDASGYPHNILYQRKSMKPGYEDSLNKFYNIRIDTTVLLNGTFYVGWQQLTNDNLNVGFDLNNDEHSKIYYNIGSGWSGSNFNGALMVRPVLGKVLPPVAGINEITPFTGNINVYPNPSTDGFVNIELDLASRGITSGLTTHLFDVLGKEVYNAPYSATINVSGLQNGLYLLTVTSKDNNHRYSTRLVIAK